MNYKQVTALKGDGGYGMSDENYEKIIAAIPNWRPTYYVPKFGVDAIQRIVKCDLHEAVEVYERLIYEGALPKLKY